MIDYRYNWAAELDDGRIRCPNCTRRFDPDELSPAGLCEACVVECRQDERELRAEAGRRP